MSDSSVKVPERAGREGVWGRLRKGLNMTHTEILERIGAAVKGQEYLGEETFEELEESLIAADLGVETALGLIERLRREQQEGSLRGTWDLQQRLVDEMSVLLLDVPRIDLRAPSASVILLVGVNGAGKTTTAAKLAHWFRANGDRVLLAAADTFRAAAVEQLQTWGERAGVEVIRQPDGADPAAVVFDALQAGRARSVERIIVDTAGRLHNKENLMRELAKIRRVVEREAADRVCHTLLLLDATTGQNGVAQAKSFLETSKVDGVVLSKIDGTAKGGVVVSIARDLEVPVVFLGVGEGMEDLVPFQPREFASALLG